MKSIKKGLSPVALTEYAQTEPMASWRDFTAVYERKHAVQKQIKTDQGGLCVYCEIDLLEGVGGSSADFRVEHFHPKSDNSTTHNWHLDWQNLLGCCHGGSCKTVMNALVRFDPKDASCDVPKGEKDLTEVILNPLTLPAFPALFTCKRTTGVLLVNEQNCTQANISVAMAQASIDELNLNANRLTSMRKSVLNKLNDEMRALISQGKTLDQAQAMLASIYLRKNNSGNWIAFFTAIRSYLGHSAEQHLQAIEYKG